jgi:hypothetical protein
MMERLKLTVNEAKTKVCRVPAESFNFLGYTFGRRYSPRTGNAYLAAYPADKKVRQVCRTISELTSRRGLPLEAVELVERLNRTIRGWANYFSYGTASGARNIVDQHTAYRLRQWLRRKHKGRWPGRTGHWREYLHQTLGLLRASQVPRRRPWATA